MISISEESGRGGFADEMRGFFSEEGALSRSRDFEYRPEQQEMAVKVASALSESRPLVIEAGTGVGKSLAYLAPAVRYARETKSKAVISTHTIQLQEQLIGKDIPILRKVMGEEFEAVLLKGRRNYICPNRLKWALKQGDDLFSRGDRDELEEIREWCEETRDGTLSDLEFAPKPALWSQVCSESHACTPKTCGVGSLCFYQEARRRVGEADVVVLNHTLFFTLLASMEGMDDGDRGFLFPDDFVIFDEAHTIEGVAQRQLGMGVSQYGVRHEAQRLYHLRTRKGLLRRLADERGIEAVKALHGAIDEFFSSVEERCRFGEWGREFRVRNAELVEDSLAAPLAEVEERVRELAEDQKADRDRIELDDLAGRLRDARLGVRAFLDQELEEHVYWVEKSGGAGRTLTLNAAPIDMAERLREVLFAAGRPCVLTSATLSIGAEDLGYFRNRIGAEHVEAECIGSPFDYERQMKVYVAKAMPAPDGEGYEDALSEWVRHFVDESGGRAFVLFTSYRLLRSVAEKTRDYFADRGWTLLTQGDGRSPRQILEEFREDTTSVLFGTDTFWTGVDVPGESLSNVIVTRLPFAVPDHPLVASRLEKIQEDGGNSFMEYSLPEAILKLRQGIGRLIRSNRDRGIVVLLDNRVLTKRYGSAFLRALPDAPIEVVNQLAGPKA
ncbi:MAG: helicase C-terminal domain-containing protein [Verrucomicrobiota bacterium]